MRECVIECLCLRAHQKRLPFCSLHFAIECVICLCDVLPNLQKKKNEQQKTQYLFLVNWQKIVVVADAAVAVVVVVNKSKQSFDAGQ